MIDKNTLYEGGMSDEQFGNLLGNVGQMERESPMPTGFEGVPLEKSAPPLMFRFKAVRHEEAGKTEVNVATGKTVRGGQFAPATTGTLTTAQEKQVQTALTSGQAEITKDGTKYALKVKPAGKTRFRAVGTFKTLKEAKANVLPALGVDGKDTKVTAYQDVGAKIGGARKDIASARSTFEVKPTEDGLTALEKEDPAAAARAVKKSTLWPLPGVAQMKAAGLDADTVYAVHALHSLIAPKPEVDTAMGRGHYFRGLQTLQAMIGSAPNYEQLTAVMDQLKTACKTASRAAQLSRIGSTWGAGAPKPTQYEVEMATQMAALGNRFYSFLLGSKPATIKGRETYWSSLFRTRDRYEPTEAVKWDRAEKAFGVPGEGAKASTPDAPGKVKTNDQLDIEAERERLREWERTIPTTYERKGGKTVAIRRPEEYLKHFGLRGVEFGHYMDDDASRLHVERCAEAFQDLADVLGISPKELSMNGRLALAFGARGHGKAAAHYEPHKVVINLTKGSGVGSLAHEWAHFLDHTLRRVQTDTPDSMDYFSAMVPSTVTERATATGPVESAILGVMRNIYAGGGSVTYKPTPTESMYGLKRYAQKYLEDYKNDPQVALDKFFARYPGTKMSQMKEFCDHLATKTGVTSLDIPTKTSPYYERMKRMDNGTGKYWSNPQEMFARCFEAYVQDTLASKKRMNNYLVWNGKQEDAPLPQGKQRAAINAHMADLVNAIREGGVLKKAMEMEGSPFDTLIADGAMPDMDAGEGEGMEKAIGLHGTASSFMPKIFAEGLRSSKETGIKQFGKSGDGSDLTAQKHGVYMAHTEHPGQAISIANGAGKKRKSDPMVLMTHVHPHEAQPDEDYTDMFSSHMQELKPSNPANADSIREASHASQHHWARHFDGAVDHMEDHHLVASHALAQHMKEDLPNHYGKKQGELEKVLGRYHAEMEKHFTGDHSFTSGAAVFPGNRPHTVVGAVSWPHIPREKDEAQKARTQPIHDILHAHGHEPHVAMQKLSELPGVTVHHNPNYKPEMNKGVMEGGGGTMYTGTCEADMGDMYGGMSKGLGPVRVLLSKAVSPFAALTKAWSPFVPGAVMLGMDSAANFERLFKAAKHDVSREARVPKGNKGGGRFSSGGGSGSSELPFDTNYPRTIPRDLFNEANLLKCYGQFYIALEKTEGHKAELVPEEVDQFLIGMDQSSGETTVTNVDFQVGGKSYLLVRPMNSRESFPLYVRMEDYTEVEVFDDSGNFTEEMLGLIRGG